MERVPLERRDFLRLCVVAAGSVLAAACQKAVQEIATETEAIGTSTATASPGSDVKVSLTGKDQDVWAWTKQVKGKLTGECKDLVVSVNGREFETQPDDENFVAEVRLSEGENRVSATCRQSDGGEIQSNMLNYTERLRQTPTAVINISIDGDHIIVDGGQSLPVEGDGSKILDHIWSARLGNPFPLAI
ncbi:MAG TPA: hypothetical protein VKB04_07395, partial [Anaerolineales bacterium]|nr:hypothetical protein [Anaerolineales bacterium]